MNFGCKLPINDLYGEASHKFLIPDSMYNEAPASNPTGISTAAANKDLPALFTMLNWLYSEDGWKLTKFGLNEEQYRSMSYSNDYYATLDITAAYEQRDDGKYYYNKKTADDASTQKALNAQRLVTSVVLNTKKGDAYSKVLSQAIKNWGYYKDQTDVVRYTSFMTSEQSITYNNKLSQIRTYADQQLPLLIKNGLSGWNTYAGVIRKYNYQVVNDIYDDVFAKLG